MTLKGGTTFPIQEVAPSTAGVYVYAINSTWAEGTVSYYLPLRLRPGVA